MTFQLPGPDEKAGYVLRQFDRIADRYDFANDLISFGMHRRWKERAVAELLAQEGASSQSKTLLESRYFLDVCTGTGDLAMLIAEKSASRVLGLDFSSRMLAVARQRSVGISKSDSRLSFLEGDAQKLPFPDKSFDGAVISFGLRNLSDLAGGLSEMSRVVKSAGKVVALDLGQPDLPVFTPLFLFFFERIVPLVGDLILNEKQAYTYLPESRKTYPHPELLSRMFRQAGLLGVRHEKLAFGSVALHVGTVP